MALGVRISPGMSPKRLSLARPRRHGIGAASRTARRSCRASTNAWRSRGDIATSSPRLRLTKAVPTVARETRMQLIRRFASGAVLAEALEARLVKGEQVDIAEHALLSSTLVRLAQRIGINRVAKDVSPTLGDYLHDPSAFEEAAE